jgi:hypothetical protein
MLITGVPSSFFGSSREIHQGDPLSSFLFVLVMEAFSMMLGAFTDRGLISGFLWVQVSQFGLSSLISFLQMIP